jgi:hypothetical protein
LLNSIPTGVGAGVALEELSEEHGFFLLSKGESQVTPKGFDIEARPCGAPEAG